MRLIPLLLLLASTLSAAPLRQLPRASDADLAPLVEWNRAGRRPERSAIVRALPEPIAATLDGTSAWYGSIRVEDAYAITLRLTGVSLPPDARISLRTERDDAGPLEVSRLLHQREIVTPPIRGEEIEILVDGGPGEFRIESIVEWFELDEHSLPLRGDRLQAMSHISCTVDATCVETSTLASIDRYRKAVARMTIVTSSGGSLCTGALIRDSDDADSAAYFLTASHCVASATDAARASFRWSYRPSACNAGDETFAGQTFGATILAANSSSDATLLQLNEPPPSGIEFLEWSATLPPADTPLYRISHPGGTPQKFSTSAVTSTIPPWCGPLPFPDAIISRPTGGRFGGGSSGAPMVTGDGKIVGQLYGDCYDEAAYDACHYETYYAVDGAFRASAAAFAPWLTPPSCPTPYIIGQPASSETTAGGYASASVVASRRAPFTYQWYRGAPGDTANPFPGATAAQVALGPFDATTTIWVRVGNACGTTDSAAATITVTSSCLAPNITQQPESRSIRLNESVTLRIVAEGNAPIGYQWYRRVNGETSPISGATTAVYTTPPLTVTTTFFAIVANSCGQTTSNSATITVVPALRRRAARRG